MASMMMGGNNLPGGFHQDVLSATPSDAAGRRNLADECKSRAKGSLGSKNYPEAITLYEKAIEVMTGEDDPAYLAILYANMSMCKLNMGKSEEAAVDADKAISLDETYVKAYYRAGAAYQKLKKWEEAKKSLLAGLERKPDDKEMRNMMDKVQAAIVRGESSASSNNKTAKQASNKTPTKVSASKPSKSGSVSSSSTVVDDDDIKGEELRGYKKTSDGRTTSYFNNELDEATKQLIGDITPQAITAPGANTTATEVSTGGSSAWNSAGTFESKNKTSWAKETITEMFKNTTFSNSEVHFNVKEVKDMEGEAEIIMNRGKKKAIYDMSAIVTFEAHWEDESFEGSVSLTDITGDDEPETSHSFTKSLPSSAKPKVLDALRGFIDAINKKCGDFRTKILELK